MKLMLVESPATARKIATYLGSDWRVEACCGRVRDLPEDELGVAVDDDFRPTYRVLPCKSNLVRKIVKALREAEAVYLATAPDREGEANAWHLLQVANMSVDQPVYRVVFPSMTRQAVLDSLSQPRRLDLQLVEAQQASRILDRLIGYLVSPLASRALSGDYSADRVHSAALRLVVERERAMTAFTPDRHWTLMLDLAAENQRFSAKLHQIQGADRVFQSREMLDKVVRLLAQSQLWVGHSGRSIQARQPLPPFTMATLQQAAARDLGLSPARTMAVAQILYEQGRITYPHTGSVTVVPEAQQATRRYLTEVYGQEYVPAEVPTDRSSVQEGIRPTDVCYGLDHEQGEGAALYNLIRKRFLASQMAPALYTVSTAVIYAGKRQGQPFPLEFRAQGRTPLFEGFLTLYPEAAQEGEADSVPLPVLDEGLPLMQVAAHIDEHLTRPPTRYTEADLIQALEQRGIGRPSTYVSSLKRLRDKGYVQLHEHQLQPTASGQSLCDFLTTHFPQVFALDYSAHLETQLDRIALGESTRPFVLKAFWQAFRPQLTAAVESQLAQVTPQPLSLHPLDGGSS